MRRIHAYEVITARQSLEIQDIYNSLIGKVNEHIANGWQPFGSPFLDGGLISQAIVKYEAESW